MNQLHLHDWKIGTGGEENDTGQLLVRVLLHIDEWAIISDRARLSPWPLTSATLQWDAAEKFTAVHQGKYQLVCGAE